MILTNYMKLTDLPKDKLQTRNLKLEKTYRVVKTQQVDTRVIPAVRRVSWWPTWII